MEQKKEIIQEKNKARKRIRNDKAHLAWFVMASISVVVMVVLITLNFGVIRDLIIGVRYRPTPEMEHIRESLGLADAGLRIFNASMPELKERAEFNQNCREIENETAILGCYTDERIYVFDVASDELNGIKELTTAHELLHAVYDRMTDNVKSRWGGILKEVYEQNKDILGGEIELYPEDQKLEELYVRIGTEIKDLPIELEKHYAETFVDQDKIVDYYNSYITVFREIEKNLEVLFGQIKTLKTEIDTKSAEYENGMTALSAEIDEFNSCAGTVNCFKSSEEFNSRRAELVAKQGGYEKLYNAINEQIKEYNNLIEKYNENVLHGQQLNMTINSSVNPSTKVEEIENN